jgi:hypothetical protein
MPCFAHVTAAPAMAAKMTTTAIQANTIVPTELCAITVE